MQSLLKLFDPKEIDSVTIAEVKHYAQLKYDEQAKIKGQIARDLERIGENAYCTPSAYTKLKGKYKAANAGKKKLEILDNMRKAWCQCAN